MLIAQTKRKENIIEYILYMYQIEDIIRSFQFNMELIDQAIVQKYDQSDAVKAEIKNWYADLIEQLQSQGLERKGHIKSLKEIINELQVLHDKLVTVLFDQDYIELYESAKPHLKELTVKAVGQSLNNQIDVAIHGLYGYLMLRLKNQEISDATKGAMEKITTLLAHLASHYKKNN